MNLSYLIYVSTESRWLDRIEFNDILSVCTKNNQELDVTGMLLYIEGRFFQVLEGDAEVIQRLFENISKDSRHMDITLVARGPLDRRIFKDWTMRFKAISKSEFARISGINNFNSLLSQKAADQNNLAWTFARKFSNKTFPSENWWKE